MPIQKNGQEARVISSSKRYGKETACSKEASCITDKNVEGQIEINCKKISLVTLRQETLQSRQAKLRKVELVPMLTCGRENWTTNRTDVRKIQDVSERDCIANVTVWRVLPSFNTLDDGLFLRL
jgi:hypothetical protein